MAFIEQNAIAKEKIGPGRERYLGYTDKLMMVVIDFHDGPASEPDPPHSHPHEQVSYVVTGELVVHIGEESKKLGPGDIFTVPPGIPHTVRLLSKHVRLVDTFTPIRDEFIA